ncbi:G-protein coupled receptor 12 [Labeo rohita]|uniref:G-protein coupled receptor 12 n=1 Tax=Labeo rohita TaxID=84645 RepID=A0ABQ8LE51_LABRO|nr:G-protein coupled receptor 12 [Labeo rohita]
MESSPLPAPRTAAVGGDARADGEEPLLLLAVTILRSGITASDSSVRPRGAAPVNSAGIKCHGKTRRPQKHLNRRLSSKRQGREASRWGVNENRTGGRMSEEVPVSPSWLAQEPTWGSSGAGSIENITVGTYPPAVVLTARPPAELLVNPWDIVLCSSGTLIACENALVVLVIWQNPALRAPMFLLIGSLALADLLAGLGLVLHFTFAYLLRSDSAQLLTVGLVVASFSASVFSLLAITIDRYLSLYYALTYNSERTAAFTYTMLVLLWGVSLCLGLLPVTGVNCLGQEANCSVVWPLTKNNVAVLSVSFLLLFGLMLQLYVQICKIVMRHAHQIALQHHFLAASPHYVTTRKGVSTLAIILGTFAACWMPFTVYSLIADYTYPPLYTYATLVPATYNSVINPVIYAFRNQEIQKALWLVCCGCIPASVAQRARTPSDRQPPVALAVREEEDEGQHEAVLLTGSRSSFISSCCCCIQERALNVKLDPRLASSEETDLENARAHEKERDGRGAISLLFDFILNPSVAECKMSSKAENHEELTTISE